MYILLISSLIVITGASAAPGYGFESPLYAPPILKAAPIFSAPTIYKTPIYSPPILKTPIYEPPPIYAPPPTIIKTIAPIVKTIPPATSYATFTQYHVTHPVVVKTFVAPQPVLKTIAIPSYDHGYH